MYTIICTLTALGFFVLYNTSQKVKFNKSCVFTQWIRSHKKPSVVIALLLLTISLILEIIVDGVAIGIFTFLVYLMFIGSAILSLYPTLSIRLSHIGALIGGCLFFEVILL